MQISKRKTPRFINSWADIALVASPLAPLDQAFGFDERRLTICHIHTQKTLDSACAVHGVPADALRDAEIGQQRNGVGYYKQPNCIHMDTGRLLRR